MPRRRRRIIITLSLAATALTAVLLWPTDQPSAPQPTTAPPQPPSIHSAPATTLTTHPLTTKNPSAPVHAPTSPAHTAAPLPATPIVRVDPEVLRRRFRPAPSAARLPLVLALPPEEMPGLNERQTTAAIAIAEQFAATLGGETADPSTTDYRDRWKREQPLADYQLRAAIGAQAYARYQEAAYLRSKAPFQYQ